MRSYIGKKRAEGFTIIEVLIVLAIAGLILLVVFLAVPALQRNARNTQRNADVAGILGAVNEFINNNNGLLPNSATATGGVVTVTNSSVSGVNPTTSKTGYYKTFGESWSSSAAGTTGVNSTTIDTLTLYSGADCNSLGTQALNGSSRGVAGAYTLEASAKQCKSL